ncbi:DegQ family serine endoprotease [Acidovorax sp. SUPP2522]|uniref:DegQ family serine endoprotease n=1 Tax=unclassified Acidovorax TaxID=2684926 RepID=UPI00234B3BC7|nr:MULTISPECIES: DegQ family serine endoprotease [unclassified Acidovorax]WCM96871.1 DegQ family serine endoprotease [Acidovorax sp. GBBC 1281]GKT14947.1 DegQ family serine endoprotease [Acidovorax sp. SUPP2522]
MNSVLSTPRRLTLALLTAGAIGATGAGLVTNMHSSRAAMPPAAVQPAAMPYTGGVTAPDFAQITARNGPAVVNISVSGTTKTSMTDSDDDDDETAAHPRSGAQGIDPNDPMFEFFRRFGMVPPGLQAPSRQREVPTRGEGSGFIVSADGVILTNAHVVKGANMVTVKLTDRREFRAKVLGSDPKTDIAVLKIDAKDLPVVQLGSTRNLAVGEWVLAIGSPFGFENSVTAGVVSAKGRSLPDDSYVPFIQTDVAVNPGNSGGPLFNARGEVVGINSQIYSRSGGYQGVSFSIPIEVAAKVKDQILATGNASHARLGVSVQEVNQAFADSFQLDKPEGALVAGVEEGGPADKAGLKSGDVIRSVNGQPIVASGDLPAIVGQAAPGTQARLEVWRHGKREEFTATLGDASEKATKIASSEKSSGKGRLGLALRPLQPQERRDAGVDGGLLVEDARGPAALAGVQPGDVLLAINGTPARGVEQVREAMAKAGKSVALLIQRDGDKIFVPVPLG